MNKINSIMRTLLALVLLSAVFSSCKNKEELVFPKLSNDRVLDLVTDAEKTLLSSEYGWETSYTTASNSTFLLQFKFMENKDVVIYSDYDSEPSKSSYKFSASRGAVLTFDSYGLLHDLAHPTIKTDITVSPSEQEKQKGRGYGGDFEFEILKVTPDTIFLRGMKDQERITKLSRMTKPADANVGVTEAAEFVKYLNTSNGYMYKTVEVDGVSVAEFFFDSSKGELVSKNYDKPTFVMDQVNQDGERVRTEIEAIKIDNGFKLKEPVTINGKEYMTFVRSKRNEPFVAQDNPSVVLNINGNIPSIPRAIPRIETSDYYWVNVNSIWCSDMFWNMVIQPFRDKVNNTLTEIGFFGYSDGPRALYLWASNPSHRFDIPANYVQIKDNVFQLQHLNWKPEAALYDQVGNGFHEFVEYFTNYFDPNTKIVVEDLGRKEIRIISGKDSRLWFVCHL